MIRKLQKLDLPILFILILFWGISTAVIYSATLGTSFQGIHMNNLITYGVLLVPMLGLCLIDYRVLVQQLAYPLYGFGLALLLFVYFKGMNINGSQRWINLKVMVFQPSEVMKLFLILVLARWLKSRSGQSLRFFHDLVPMTALVGVPFLMVLQQPDMGTSIVLLSIFAGMLWIGNIQWKHLIAGTITAVSAVTVITLLYFYDLPLFSKIIKPHQLHRIQTFLDPTSDPDHSWHVINSIRAIATGELSGEGFLHGKMVRGGFIPYDYADSIFVVIGEEFGFIGASVLLLLYFILIYRMIKIAIETEDLEGRFIIIGVISMFTLQIFENIAMHTGLMPLTGIALPFISYGGSSLMTNLLGMGLVLSVKIHRN
ncbi:FtsW/RodA/SpoVE family cell cycle protein [Paenibacillus filicis]|uniref:FtsW/RodA/SpoVE family cell cycle protein n=1 Tax=Paenibacillus gyeongsangnamensis TaxID=3388067 RepID=A0ABT4QGI8_9BACL|nr:FtsW/RodA/SpoVE family cell cycle protein [Paenibacillus filicis]MCZ8515981.1 FtsW/RodA/SpoVE family cell cycle protein [Paenibacillus filicis]